MEKQKVGFIGCGNMGGALSAACAKTGAKLLLSDRDTARSSALAEMLGTQTAQAADNETIASECEFIFLGVKPQALGEMLADIAPALKARKDRFVLVSMAAGQTIASVRKKAGGEYPIVRIMPNTPACVGEGMILYCTEGTTAEETAAFLTLLAPAGALDLLPESLIDAASAVSGCGPAFVYPFLEALADGAVACGLPRAKAQMYAAQTILGAAKLALRSGEHPGALKDAVCSPAGSTIQGVRVLEEKGMRGAVMDAVIAAYDKTRELGK